MSALNRKLLRDLYHIWPQAMAIALVMAAGVATLILSTGAHRSLYETREAYYERYRFADVFAHAKRAPKPLIREIAAIPGVAAAEARVRGTALLDIPDLDEPASAQLLSLPEFGEPRLNALYIQSGNLPSARRRDEIAVNTGFARAHGLRPGDTIKATVGGKSRELRITALADSPEFIFTLAGGNLVPDEERNAVIWMLEPELAAAYDVDGAFNDVTVRLLRGGDQDVVIERLDQILKTYGGRGAYARKDQQSHAFIDAELVQLRAMAVILPPIFLSVAAFLINMTLARIIAMEREQIGLLKALGYHNSTIAWHYIGFGLVISVFGLIVGSGLGWWLGRGLTRLYGDLYRFPFLYFTDAIDLYVIAALVAIGAGALGALQAVLRAARLAPAVAMQPPAPPTYRRFGDGMARWLPHVSQLSLMIVRQIIRWPVRAALTCVGISFAVMSLVSALFGLDSVEFMVDVAFFRIDRQDATIVFRDPQPLSVIEDVMALPGVISAEPQRAVSARIAHGSVDRRISLTGKLIGADHGRILDTDLRVVQPDEHGIILSEKLAEILRVVPGGTVTVEALEGRGHTFTVPVAGLSTGFIGLGAAMDYHAVNRLMLDPPVVSSVSLMLDRAREDAFFAEIKDVPSLSGVTLNRKALENFRETIGENIGIIRTIYMALGSLIAFGVVYNTARIRLSERGRELASLRVLGFTRAEIYWVLFGEFLILVLISLPVGWVLGYQLASAIMTGAENELYQIPVVVLPHTYAQASLVALSAAAVSALLLRLRTDKLDLIAVLKTRE